MLVVEVSDNGVGGAMPGRRLGLGSLADRAGAVGGWLAVHIPRGRGTQVVAEPLCAS
jgi:signal transduction histidine kinase